MIGKTDKQLDKTLAMWDFIKEQCGSGVSTDTLLGLEVMDVQSLDEVNEIADRFDSVGDNETELLQAAFRKWEFIDQDKSGTCLHCSSPDVELEPMLDNEVIGSCRNCNGSWVEVYELIAVRDE